MATVPMGNAKWQSALLLVIAACGPGGPGEPDNDDDSAASMVSGSSELRGACEGSERVGSFRVVLGESETSVSGEVADGVIPSAVPKVVASESGCTLWRSDNPFCDPPCSAGTTCDFDGSCIPEPAPQNVGTVEVSGLAQEVRMELPEGGFLYFDTSLPHPGFQPGAEIGLVASGGDLAGFSLFGHGVEALLVSSEAPVLRPGQDLEISWTAGSGAASLAFALNIDQHGNTPITVNCEAADGGSFAISGGLIQQLIDAGVSGFPSLRITRRTADRSEFADLSPGCVDFTVSSTVTQTPSIDGHVPCKSDADCPEEQTCDLATETCVDG